MSEMSRVKLFCHEPHAWVVISSFLLACFVGVRWGEYLDGGWMQGEMIETVEDLFILVR